MCFSWQKIIILVVSTLSKSEWMAKSFLCPTYNMAYTGMSTNLRTRRWF